MSNKKPKIKIRPTNFGYWVLFLAFFLLFSSQNTGNNLLYLVCSCVFTALIFGLVNLCLSLIGFKAELIYPSLVNVGQTISIICKIEKNIFFPRYYLRFEDTWLESIPRGNDGYLRKDIIFDKRGTYLLKGFSIFKPSMFNFFYFQYIFPDLTIYAINNHSSGYDITINGEAHSDGTVKSHNRDGEFYAHEVYQEGLDASFIDWNISSRSNEDWIVVREKSDEERKRLEQYKESLKSTSLPFEKIEILGKNYSELVQASLTKELNPFVFRIMVLLAVLVCFGINNIGYLQNIIPWVALLFVIFAAKGSPIKPKYHKYVYYGCVLVAIYIIFKSFMPNAPARIVLLLEFSLLILVLQYITMTNIRNILGALTLVFMVLLGIAAMNVNSAFPAIFLPFLIFASMLLAFLRVNLVATGATVKNKFSTSSKGIIDNFIIMCLFILIWLPFFYIIPRTNIYGYASNLSEERSTKGFSNNTLNLNDSSFLEDNSTVIMRITPNDEVTITPSILRRLNKKLIRGGSFSEYENGEWKKLRRGLYVRDLSKSSGEIVIDRNFNSIRKLYSFDVTIDNSDVPTVFIPDETKKIIFHEYNIGLEMDGSMFFVERRAIYNKKYTILTLLDSKEYEDSPVTELLNYEYYYRFLNYLSLNGISDRIIGLSNSLEKNSDTIDGRVQAVMEYLKKNYSYSLEQPELNKNQEPVDYFLFEGKSGSCQHFSSAMVFLLRGMGIPSRVVNGYTMGDWNEIGEFFTVRQSHAHAWVEVFFPNYGWVPFDPTPSDTGENTSEFWDFWNKIKEIYEGYWFKYIYSFDKKAQNMGKKGFIFDFIKDLKKYFFTPTQFYILLILLIIVFLFRKEIKIGYRYLKKSSPWIPFCYQLWELKLKHKRNSNETPAEFHKRLWKEKLINDDSRKLLKEVEELIDEYAFKKNVNKFSINREINRLLLNIKI